MNRFRLVHSFVHAGIAGLCWFVLNNIDIAAESVGYVSFFANNKRLSVLAVLAALALLFRLSDKLSNALVEKVPVLSWVIRRVLSGKEFIEGDWPLIVVDMAEKKLLYLGFLTIAYKNGQPFVLGEDWTPEGANAHKFRSVQARYDSHVLQYWYEQGASLHEPSMEGYTKIYFFPETSLAERHAGKFLDPDHTTDIRFYAELRKYRWFEPRMSTKEEKLQVARALWDRFKIDIDAHKAHLISADFA